MPAPKGPQWDFYTSSVRPFDVEDAEIDPQAVQAFNKEHLDAPLGPPTHSTWHTYGTKKGEIATAETQHHPKGIVLKHIHVNQPHRGKGVGSEILGDLTGRYGKLFPSGHYVSQQALDWHNKNWRHFSTDPEYGGDRIVEDEQGW